MRFSGVVAVAVVAAALCMSSAAVQAETYPSRPVRLVVPYAAGGGVDIVARTVGQKMSALLGQPIVVDNRPGGHTNIGLEAVAKAQPDGYTVLMASNSIATNGSLFPKLPFDPVHDFTPVARVGFAPLVLVVPAKSGPTSLKALIEQAKAKPGSLSYGSAGNGSSGHLASELFKDAAGIDVLHVPYKGGAPAITDLLGERLSFMLINPLEVLPHLKAGTMRALAVASDQRSPLLADVPTMREQGIANANASVWWGLLAPAKTPAAVLKSLNEAANKALADPAVKKQLSQMGVTIVAGTPENFGQFVRSETSTWTGVIRKAGVTAD
jgi:tripartite-type tricarboxylate transporter receptor subunit TctC